MMRKRVKLSTQSAKTPRRFSWAIRTISRPLPGVTPLTGCGSKDDAPIKQSV